VHPIEKIVRAFPGTPGLVRHIFSAVVFMHTDEKASVLTAPSLQEEAPPSQGRHKSKIAVLYHRCEKYSEIAIFGLGFIWDSLTMTRVDNMVDNVILLFYFVVIGTMISLTLRRQCGAPPLRWIQKIEPKFLWAMQFCFGGLFSSYVIFYFKSASWTRTQFFFLILVCLWVGNEFLQHRLKNSDLLAVLYCFCLFSFFAFFLPVVFNKVSVSIFLLAGVLSLGISLTIFSCALLADRSQWRNRMIRISALMGSVWLLVNFLYFANLIPPVPLALKSAGIYHYVAKTPAGFEVKYVAPPFYRFWKKWDDPFYYSAGERVFCYSAIFAPGRVQVPVRHIWSYKSPNGWQKTDQKEFWISAGREGGYRGYTWKSSIRPGEWRVAVETERGQTLGVIEFTIVPGPAQHLPLQTILIR
jgi:hypothetical protein